MKCPMCETNDQFKTIESRPKEWGVKRRKECLVCGYHVATIEISEPSKEAFKSLARSQRLIDTRLFNRRKKENEKV